ncbi:VanW family protein [Clostridium sp.]|uniref:VanW family protein n=1 Tax=Clostridium sp. TaxID=1506 RepID=UPI002FCC264F
MDINLERNKEQNNKPTKNKVKNSKNKKKFIVISAMLGIVVLAFIGTTSYVYTTVNKYKSVIMPGVNVEGIDISGQTIDEAMKTIGNQYEKQISDRNIKINVEGKEYSINYSDIKLEYNIEHTVQNAFNYGKDLNSVKVFNLIRNPENKDFNLEFTYNNEAITRKVSEIEKEVNKEKKDATIKKNPGGGFSIVEESLGAKLDVSGLIAELNSKIASTKEGNVQVKATVNKDNPKVTKEQLSKIDSVVSSFTTAFGTSTSNRATNISIGTRTVNATLLMPGDKFSFNSIVGDTTAAKGYKSGGAYIDGVLVDDIGGGICQVSSTLHNAVLRLGILPDQRRNHSMTVGYVPLGLDATIFYGGTDYTFTNSTQYPIYIEGFTDKGKVTFNLYSNSSLIGKTYSFPTETYETIAPPVKYVDDPTLEVGKEVIDKPGSNGYKVKAYRVTYENGKEISRELMNNDTYKPSPKIIKRGTKPVQGTNTGTDKPKDEIKPGNNQTPTTPTTQGEAVQPNDGENQ